MSKTEKNEAQEPEAEAPKVDLSEEELQALCKAHVCTKCAVMAEAEDIKLRALADNENFKRRIQRETEEVRRYSTESVLSDLLPVLDNLTLALEHAGDNPACKNLVMGVEMTRKIFLDTLKRHGLECVGACGETFDPAKHEAIGTVCEAGQEEDCVTKVTQSGYVLKGRVIRPAKVLVNKKTEA
ncbi:MAG: nucleotide exchange factor GrpE [Humidesulfovibrio sp.]|uniref:nucleotide exchange factor GrpE n=1 Tax=Humidesulfovibrio sp. TaxID=2910988 RepID=UPI0027EAAB6A|nr:nucleotide exchange factor GrpE [Humidesulfovibrio sp.]MDQ7834157.1 nucleotide exchange factor GrpE [Humidesulfovibrio sp.]